jgi:hypothetical protein
MESSFELRRNLARLRIRWNIELEKVMCLDHEGDDHNNEADDYLFPVSWTYISFPSELHPLNDLFHYAFPSNILHEFLACETNYTWHDGVTCLPNQDRNLNLPSERDCF